MRGAALVAVIALWTLTAAPAHAALPPLELAQKSLAQARAGQPVFILDLRVTETSAELKEWRLRGTFSFGDMPDKLGPKAPLPLRLLWIATLSADPVAELQKAHGLINANTSTVGVQDGFVYVYGTTPSFSLYRDLKRLAAFSVTADGKRWVARLAYDGEGRLSGLMITRDGRTVLTARSGP